MDAWQSLTFLLYGFPPTAIAFIACLVKLFALLEEKQVTWGKAFGIAFVINVVLLLAWVLYTFF